MSYRASYQALEKTANNAYRESLEPNPRPSREVPRGKELKGRVTNERRSEARPVGEVQSNTIVGQITRLS